MLVPLPAVAPVAPVCEVTVQEYVVPVTVPLKLMFVATPEQKVWVEGEAETVGVGLTVTVKLIGEPVQPFADGVTVTVVVIGAVLVLLAVNAGIFPVPFVPKPTLLVEVQVYVVPATAPVKLIAGAAALLQ